jgi:carbamoyltransferase
MIFIAIQCGHNSTIGLSIDGKIISVISEERITRKKNFEGFPIESLKYIKSKYLNNDFSKVNKFLIIDETGQTLNFVNQQINQKEIKSNFKYNENLNKKMLILSIYNLLPKALVRNVAKIRRKIKNKNLNLENKNRILKKIFRLFPDIAFNLNKVEFYNHHEMHALSFCYFFDNIDDELLVFTMDGEGDEISSSVSTLKDGKIKKISKNTSNNKVGYLYSQITSYLGLKPFEHEFKVMGMAPYGKSEDVSRIYSKINHLLYLDNKGNFKSKITSNLFKFEIVKFLIHEKFQNICGAIQKMTESLILSWVNFWIKKKSINKIIVSGGVFMNIKACKELLSQNEVESLFVVPSSTDDSLIFGALWKANKNQNINIKKIENLYLGRNFKNEAENFIQNNISEDRYEILKFENYQKLNDHVSDLLCKNEIIGRCYGREEWGARALGNRSIICNPSKLENVRLINTAIKERDYWMPFSPTILDIDEKKYLYNKKKFSSDFMTCLFDSTDLARKDLICAIHPMDFTMRPQVLKESQNPSYYDLISKFKNKSNIGAVLNTSFNLHGFPNVSSHQDAFFTFENSNLKYLIIENYLIKKN